MAAAASSAGSSVSSVFDASEEKTNGTRLTRLLVDGGTNVLRNILNSIYPPATLQHVLNNNRVRLSRRVKFDDQWEKLFPSSGDPPDSETFDITLLHFLIREICCLTAPVVTGWHKMPAEDDESVEAHITRIRCFRNKLCHRNSTGIPNDEFEKKWKQISSSLEALELYAYRRRIERLKSDPIDHDIQRRVKEEVNRWEELDSELVRYETEQVFIKVPSCLPDELPKELMFGRTQEIKQVTEAIQSGSVSVVWITGGPGFGKTTVASKVAHELSKPEHDRTVLFCSLRSKKTFHDAATLMTLACSTNQTQPPQNPRHWILNWSKQQVSNVTFVLDNADEILEDSECNDFMNLLGEMRTFSRNVTFVITSRKACRSPSLHTTENIRLDCLPAEEARQVLLSRMQNAKNQEKIVKVEQLVALCCFHPLALCIAGSLLSDGYSEDELIQNLEKEPSDVLQVDRRSTQQTSVETSIKSSFEVLDELEQTALILLCVFPGSFNSDAAKSLIANCTTSSKSISILRELKDRSLVEQLRPDRYQMHQLIQTFVQKISLDAYPELLNQGKKLACAHFMSRLADNAKLYWGKDTCKQSVESFNEDRHNFEHFLQIYVQGRKNQDCEIVVACQTFLEHFPQNCMYLEKCVLPRFYVLILEMLLKTFDSETQPVHRVELLCLLGHESRKQGNKEKYQKLMEEAENIHSMNHAEYETKSLSEVYFRNSLARFLSDKKDPKESERIEQETKAAFKVCREKLGEHPETAATLLFAGTLAKRRKERDQAEQMFTQALELFTKCLGKHFMTAESLKAIADLNFFLGRTEAKLDICLKYYQLAMEMFHDLGMSESKESFLTLKNFGVCHRERNNFAKAMELLTKAEQVAEQELEADHTWKVLIKTELAILHDKRKNPDQAKAVMLEGLLMGNRLNLPIYKMGNKDGVREFINRYPETFSKGEFPRK